LDVNVVVEIRPGISTWANQQRLVLTTPWCVASFGGRWGSEGESSQLSNDSTFIKSN